MKQLPTRKQVIQTLFETWQLKDKTEQIPTINALNRVLVKDYKALYSFPVVRSSAMDGVAVISERFKKGIPDTSNWKSGIDFCRADTGDDFDDTFDAVIAIEDVTFADDGHPVFSPEINVTANMNVRPCGSTVKKDAVVAKKNRRLTPLDLASLAVGGITNVEVYRKPRVAFLPTGSELVPLGSDIRRGNNIDSNSILAKSMLEEMGAEPILYPIIKDQKDALASVLNQALSDADVILINGGSSKGEEDYNARILEERGVALFHWIAAAPGRPMCVAVIDGKPVINIPGPSVALFYSMDWCVRAIVHRILHLPMPKRQTIKGILKEDLQSPPTMEILSMMDVENTADGYYLERKPLRGVSLPDVLGASAFYTTELGTNLKKAGEILEATLLRGEEEL